LSFWSASEVAPLVDLGKTKREPSGRPRSKTFETRLEAEASLAEVEYDRVRKCRGSSERSAY
jgi:hypothetical protein